MEKKFGKPVKIDDDKYRFDSFDNGYVLFGKKGKLPAMGWNSWNAFGSGNTEELTKIMADKMVELGLDKLGYMYVTLDDGCYRASRVDGHLASDSKKFPSGFKALSDYIHDKGLKFGMYNDVGSKLCSGLSVGTCGYEEVDTKDYIDWGVDFLKVDNCYNVWDNATFSKSTNAKYTFAPAIKGIEIVKRNNNRIRIELSAVMDGVITGSRAYVQGDTVVGIGTYDGTGPDATPVGELSSELQFTIDAPETGDYDLKIDYIPGETEGMGKWLQVAVGKVDAKYFYDDMYNGKTIKIALNEGENVIRLMNHRRQENTLTSYAKIQEGFSVNGLNRDIVCASAILTCNSVITKV